MRNKTPNSKTIKLENGLKIVIEELPHLRSVSLGILVGAGSIFENSQNQGVSHFIEHMMFKGTKNMTALQIAEKIVGIGGVINASTGKESTLYYCVVEDKHFITAAEVLTDILLNSLFNSNDISLEKKVILEEIRLYEDTPDVQIHDLAISNALQNHPLGNSILGTKEIVNNFSRDDLLSYFNDVYAADNIIVSVAGNIKTKQVLDFFKKNFNISRRHKKTPSTKLATIYPKLFLKTKNTEQVHFVLGTIGPSHLDEKRYHYLILDTILGGTMSSRLFQEIREKRGLAYSIESNVQSFKQIGLFTIYAGTKKETFIKTLELVLNELGKIKNDGVTLEELNRAKEYAKGVMVLQLESSKNRMVYLAKSEYNYNRVISIDEKIEKIDKIKVEEISQLAKEIFDKKYLNLTVIGNIKKLPFKTLKIS